MLQDMRLGTCEEMRENDELEDTLKELMSVANAEIIAKVMKTTGVLESGKLFTSPTPDGSQQPLLPAEKRILDIHICHGALHISLAAKIKALAEKHAEEHGWQTKRHLMHNTTDFSVKDSPVLWSLLEPIMLETVLPTLQRLYFPYAECVMPDESLALHVADLFCVKYSAMGQRHLSAHRDGSLLSFSILVNDPSDFRGGGTHFAALNKVVRPTMVGDLVTHSGQLLHSGVATTDGERWILVGFVKCPGANVRESFVERMHGQESMKDCWL